MISIEEMEKEIDIVSKEMEDLRTAYEDMLDDVKKSKARGNKYREVTMDRDMEQALMYSQNLLKSLISTKDTALLYQYYQKRLSNGNGEEKEKSKT